MNMAMRMPSAAKIAARAATLLRVGLSICTVMAAKMGISPIGPIMLNNNGSNLPTIIPVSMAQSNR